MSKILVPLSENHSRSTLKLAGEEHRSLRTFFRRDALDLHSENCARTFVVIEDADLLTAYGARNTKIRTWAFLTLVCSEISNDLAVCDTPPRNARRYKALPAVKLASMGVDDSLQGQHIGTEMMAWCITHVVKNVMPHVGCRFLLVDAKRSAVGFYRKVGFTMLNTPENRKSEAPLMFIDLHKLTQS